MATIELANFKGDTVVVHFGGSVRTIDAYTFGNSLIGFANTARAVNDTIDPGQEIEIVLEAYGPGSFRAVIRKLKKGYGGVLSTAAHAILWSVVANIIYDATFAPDHRPQVVINTNEVIIRHGRDTIIVPRAVYEATKNAKKNPDVQRGLEDIFQPLETDKNITEFGLTSKMEDPEPLVRIPRSDFPNIVSRDIILEEELPKERVRKERARLLILKAWLNHSKRKWSFEWNGVPISAPIADKGFLDRLDRREHLFGAGDALDVEVTFKQKLDPELKIYVNDSNSFLVTKVIKVVPKQQQRQIPGGT